MANLVDTSVNGDLRVTGTMFGTQAGNYATCATAAGTAAKTATISGFTLTTGIHVFVKFTVTNTAAVTSLTLNVSGTGAKSLKYRGGNLPAVGTLSASRVYEFIYDGTNWELVGDLDTNTQTVTGVKGNAESSYRTGQVNITPANIGVSATTTSVTVGDTTASIPQATTTTPKMDGTAAVGSETKWAKGDHVHPTDTSRAPTSHASSATTYGVGTTANYGHVKLDNSTPLTVGTTSTDGVATGKAHIHNAIESVARTSVTTADLAHINTNDRAHMILSQITNSTSTTHDPSDGYMLSFMWDNTGKYDAQLFIPNAGTDANNYGRLKIRYCNNSAWGDWEYLSATHSTVKLTSSDDLNNILGAGGYTIAGYYWLNTSTPANKPLPDVAYGATMVVYQINTNSTTQIVYRAGSGIYTRREASGTWTAWEKILVSSDITTGSANGTISVAGTDVAVKGLGGAAYLNTGTASGTVATGNHTHTTSIASDSSSGTVVTLAHNTQYKLTAGGTSVLFKTPADSNTDTKVTQAKDDSSTGTGFELLFSETADNTTRTEASRKSSKLTFQPSTGTLTATKFSGPLTGNVTGNCSGSSGSCTGNSATATSAGKLTTARKAYVTLGTASTTTTVDWSADPTTIPVDGTLAVSHGGTGMTTSTNVNAVVIGNSTTATNAMQTVRTGNGAFYATAQDAKPQFGTLPAAQGGTGKTSAKDACNAFINALDTGSSTPADADFYVSQYVSGGTTTTTYHRRPMSALWTYIKGKLTSVSGVNISGNAATATSATNVALTGTVKTTSTTNGDTIQFQAGSGTAGTVTIVNAKHAASADSATNSTNSAVTADTTHQLYLIGATGSSGQQALKTDTGIYATATAGQLHATTFDVNSKCTLQFNTTTNALDFVFA